MTALHKAGLRAGWALALLYLACGSDEGGTSDSGVPSDASNTEDGGHDATTPSDDAGLADAGSTDSGPHDSGPHDAGPIDSGPIDSGDVDTGPGNVMFTVNLTTEAQVPPCSSAGPAASGTALVSLWPPGQWNMINVSLTWQNLSSTLTMAHIHYGAADANGPIVLPFTNLTSPVSAAFTSMEYLAAQGAPISFDAFKQEFMDGHSYLNLHTQNCPNGELRGQIVPPRSDASPTD